MSVLIVTWRKLCARVQAAVLHEWTALNCYGVVVESAGCSEGEIVTRPPLCEWITFPKRWIYCSPAHWQSFICLFSPANYRCSVASLLTDSLALENRSSIESHNMRLTMTEIHSRIALIWFFYHYVCVCSPIKSLLFLKNKNSLNLAIKNHIDPNRLY